MRTSEPRFEGDTLNPYVIAGNELKPDDRLGYKVIAVVYHYGWAAYRGGTAWTDQEVADEGDKIDEKTALALFPAFTGRPYNH